MKKTISILVIVAMMLASVLAIIPVAAADPEGTAITTADEFAKMAADGKYYLANDITLTASYGEFKGTLDGNGKTITLTGAISAFKTLKGATVKNVNVVADFETEKLGGNYGALAVTVDGGTYSGINADVTAAFTTAVTNNIGAIFGEAKGTTNVSDSTAKGSLTIPASFKQTEKGSAGIIGVVTGGTITVTGCVNYFDIQSYIVRGSNAGIIGRIIATPVTIENCVNYGDIESVTGGDNNDNNSNGNMHCGNGGIVGQFEAPKSTTPALNIKNCRNYGNITGTRLETNTYEGNCMLGGILGRIYGSKYVTIEGCINSGNITTFQKGGTWTCLGGIIGNAETWNFNWSTIAEADFVVKRCVNLGNIKGTATNSGGIFGGLLQGNAPDIRAFMEDCANYGTIEGSHAGGIFGSVAEQGSGKITITNSYNEGTIVGANTSGGILARIASGWFISTTLPRDEVHNAILKDESGNLIPFPESKVENCINSGEVSGGTSGMIWGNSNSPAVITKCASTVDGAIAGFTVEPTETPADATAAKNTLLATIPANPTELTELVQEAQELSPVDYTSGWEAYIAAVEIVGSLVNQALSVEDNQAMVDAIKEAKEGLVELTDINFDALEAAIEAAEEFENGTEEEPKYTPATWAALVAALEAAKNVPETAKQSEVNKACDALQAAMDGIETIPDLAKLTAAIEEAKKVVEAEYVTKTWGAFADALAEAEALLVDPNATGSMVDAAIAAMDAAKAALAKKVDPKPLTDKTKATTDQYKPDDYTAMTYGKVKTAVEKANDAAKANDMSQADLDAYAKAIDEAVKGLVKRATWADVDALVATVAELRETDYTPESWEVFAKALAVIEANKKEDKKPNVSVDDEAKYLADLKAAIEGLVSYATYGDIDAKVAEIEAMDSSKYTAESWKAVQDAIKAANALKSDRYATQPMADEALAAINAAVEALVEATATPDATGGTGATEPAKKKGCGGVIATTAVVMTSVLALGAAFVAKKKED